MTLRRITIEAPDVDGHAVTFRWTVDPPTELYHETRFTLRFPPSVDLDAVPGSLWWYVALLCLHPQWPLLRPCVVELPVRLPPGETEFWCRLLEAQVVALEAHRDSSDFERRIDIVESGERLGAPVRPGDGRRFAAAFSSGKDSLLQAGLLAELTPRPLLVTTTSPLERLNDHDTPRRRQVLAAMAARPDVTLVEVETDCRQTWNNLYSRRLGYPVSVNEGSDCFVYTAAMLAVAAAHGVTQLSLATQSEGHVTTEWRGRIVQRTQHMHTVITQRSLEALLSPAGATYASIISALHNDQAQELFWTRYPHLRTLQYSCWRVGAQEAACSRCDKCLRTMMPAFSRGESPAPIGVDAAELLWHQRGWEPPDRREGEGMPDAVAHYRFEAQVAQRLAVTPVHAAVRALAGGAPIRLLGPHAWRAIAAFVRLRARARAWRPDPPAGYRAGYLRFAAPVLREPLRAIYDQHFPREPEDAYAA
ncbi:MAG TPA: hypothetical protein VML54_02555, partial [Candidatus Limnocylindrales bacterium]|nr:hypothetical protein [Candidatus Limnocylindrales bacterium]